MGMRAGREGKESGRVAALRLKAGGGGGDGGGEDEEGGEEEDAQSNAARDWRLLIPHAADWDVSSVRERIVATGMVPDTRRISCAGFEPDMEYVGSRISCPDITHVSSPEMAPDFLIVRSRFGAPDTAHVGGPDTVTPPCRAPDTAPDTSSGRSRVSHKDFVPDTGNVGTADPASDMIRVRLKVSATYLLSVQYNFSHYNLLPDTLSVS
ncbi:hypothetical protein K438DRAFT_2058797 [Mycena galopus ATCC 62051]|nr:hypothetical protein K438DRAFT_2058797 [Mycena galopus ATCC 62051]